MTSMNILRPFATIALMLMPTFSQADDFDPILVTTGADQGAGSLRAALQQAALEQRSILITTPDIITLQSGLIYRDPWPLRIIGNGQTISLPKNETILSVTKTKRLTLTNLSLQGQGGYGIENRGTPAGKGIFFGITPDSLNEFTLDLTNVTVSGVPGHGIHVTDCINIARCDDGAGASIAVMLHDVSVIDVGYGNHDADGIRVDERGEGSILFAASKVAINRAGADGVELDEGGFGDIFVRLMFATFKNNGNYCDPDVLHSFLPNPPDAYFAKGAMQIDEIPDAALGSPDDRCVKREVDLYNDGSVEAYEFSLDLDDGFDIDEAGEGGIYVNATQIHVAGNMDEGLDFDESGPGDLQLNLVQSRLQLNRDEGIKLSEENAGDLSATVIRTDTSRNGKGDYSGIAVEQDNGGIGELIVLFSKISDGIDADGVTVSVD